MNLANFINKHHHDFVLYDCQKFDQYNFEEGLNDIKVQSKTFNTVDKMLSVDFTNSEKLMVGISLRGDIFVWDIR